jgi:RNA polymerase sigma-70 factor (ECF subfamily)
MNPAQSFDPASTFDAHRSVLIGIAYRMLGQVSDAEDVVQDAWLRWSAIDSTEVHDPRAFLIRITSRLAIDRLRQQKTQREVYVGTWLPEPVRTVRDVADSVELTESISMAMLVLLESLSPLERAAFVLREAFALSYAEIAAALERSEPAVRQLLKRAREHVGEGHARYAPDPTLQQQMTERFLAACTDGNLDGLMALLAPDVTLVADSGGKAPAPRRPVISADHVARFLLGVMDKFPDDMRIEIMNINGTPGIVGISSGVPIGALVLDQREKVTTIYLVANPDKLRGLTLETLR